MQYIKFFKPYISGNELKYIQDILNSHGVISGDGKYTNLCHELLGKILSAKKCLLTTSGTASLELAIRLSGLEPGDEVIVPSFTFSSTANAALINNNLKVVFAEIDENTLNIDPNDVERKISKKTRVIIPVHYAGVAADMSSLLRIGKSNEISIIEDAAQGIGAKWKNKALGTIGDIGCISFHESKNVVCGEGGAIVLNNKIQKLFERAEILREKGTNRSKFFRGQVDKYTWVDVGSSYLPSDILAAFLYAQLQSLTKITKIRMKIWKEYYSELDMYQRKSILGLAKIPEYAAHNAHIFYVVFSNGRMRDRVMHKLQSDGVMSYFHYIPLHSSPQGVKMGYKKTDFPITERVSSNLLRLPIWAGMSDKEIDYVIKSFHNAIKVL